MRKKADLRTWRRNKIFPNLLKQNFKADAKNKIWCIYFTYIRLANGKMRYNCTIIDLYDRSAVASLNSSYINAELAIAENCKRREENGMAVQMSLLDTL